MAHVPNIVEAYKDYAPPRCVRKLVEDLLKAAPPPYLVGLQSVILTNQAGQTRDKRRQKIWSRNRKIRLIEARGYYSHATRSSQATVHLQVDNILNRASPWELRIPFLIYFPLATVLYHEIGHHIHAEHSPVYEGRENVAEDWSEKLSRQFYRNHYWYLMPLLYPAIYLVKLIRSLGRRSRSSSNPS